MNIHAKFLALERLFVRRHNLATAAASGGGMALVAGGCGQPCAGHGQAGRAGRQLAACQAAAARGGSPSTLGSSGIYPRQSPGMERGCSPVRGDSEVKTPQVSYALAPHPRWARPSIPPAQEPPAAPSLSRSSPSFSQKPSPARLAQSLGSFTLPCLVPRHRLHVGADGDGSAPLRPSAHKVPGKITVQPLRGNPFSRAPRPRL